ncbi:MAG: hypothetical protein Q8L48_00780 [Archangium sp.]|nr:hypothetical protein [Archangium sp.]
MRRSSSLLSRLALALLALMGFVAPLAAVEADRVVQTAGAQPSPSEAPEARVEPAAFPTRAWTRGSASFRRVGAEAASSRRYLLHRAWLI